jgi:microcystin degradation protein MlrC
MARIAVGGIQHETNVFAPYQAGYDVFAQCDEWPPLCHGSQMLDYLRGVNLPATGAIERLQALGHEIVPLLWCSATPSAHVTEETFERIAGMMLELLRAAAPIDGVVLDLHGAMVCTHVADGDGELLRRVRETVGEATPVVATLDLHANISDQMIARASVLEAYRTYPHVDMAATGARAADHLDLLLRHQLACYPATAVRRPDFLIPPVSGCTLVDPARSIYDSLGELVCDEVSGLSLACGFPASDVAEAIPAVVAYGFDTEAVNTAADELLAAIKQRRQTFRGHLYGVEAGVSEAMRLSVNADGPVVIADSQDNPGGGGFGDTTEILRELVSQQATGAVVGVLNDAQAAGNAHAAGVGATLEISLGGKTGVPGCEPLQAEFEVRGISEGRFRATGPMLAGADIDFGLTALLEVGGVQVVVGSKAIQTVDQSMFRHLGVELSRQKIIVVKSSIHFRNDFQEMASAILMISAPGPVSADVMSLPFQNPEMKQLVDREVGLFK